MLLVGGVLRGTIGVKIGIGKQSVPRGTPLKGDLLTRMQLAD